MPVGAEAAPLAVIAQARAEIAIPAPRPVADIAPLQAHDVHQPVAVHVGELGLRVAQPDRRPRPGHAGHHRIVGELGGDRRRPAAIPELPMAPGQPAQGEVRLILGPGADQDVHQAVGVDVHHLDIHRVLTEIDLGILPRGRLDAATHPAPAPRPLLGVVDGVFLDPRHVQQIDPTIPIQIQGCDVGIAQRDGARIRVQHAVNAHLDRVGEAELALVAVEVDSVVPIVKSGGRHQDVGQAIRVDVEELGELLVKGMLGRAPHRAHALVEALVAGQIGRAGVALGRVGLHVRVVEEHGGQRGAIRGRQRPVVTLLGPRPFTAPAAPLHRHAGEQRGMPILRVTQVIAPHHPPRDAIRPIERHAGHIHAHQPRKLLNGPAAPVGKRRIAALLVDEPGVMGIPG